MMCSRHTKSSQLAALQVDQMLVPQYDYAQCQATAHDWGILGVWHPLVSRLEQRHRSEKLQRALTFTEPGSKNSAALEASLPGNPGRVWWSSKSSKSKRVSLCMND